MCYAFYYILFLSILEGHESRSSEHSDESEVEEEATRSPEEFSSSLFPKRSAAIDMVEHLWKDFSVQDYAAIPNETLEHEQAVLKMPKEKVEQGEGGKEQFKECWNREMEEGKVGGGEK